MRTFAITLLILFVAGCASPVPGTSEAPATSPTQPQESPPIWSFTASDGVTYSAESPPGNATVLFFMATWCSSCRDKAPVVAKVVTDYAGRGLNTYSVDFDATETKADLDAWQERYHQPWPHGVDKGLKLQRQFEVTTQSTVLVLDAHGAVVKKFGYGGLAEGPFRAAIEQALSP